MGDDDEPVVCFTPPARQVYLSEEEVDAIVNMPIPPRVKEEKDYRKKKLENYDLYYNIQTQKDLDDFYRDFTINRKRFHLPEKIWDLYLENPYTAFRRPAKYQAELAIREHNSKHGIHLRLNRILRVFSFNYQNTKRPHLAWVAYYITFLASDRNGIQDIYHSKVLNLRDYITVLDDFRVAGSSSSEDTKNDEKPSPWKNEMVQQAIMFKKRYAALFQGPDERDLYKKEVERSKGFDVTSKFGLYVIGGITASYPFASLDWNELQSRLVDIARYVAKEKELHNVRVVKVNYQLVAGINYFMTLEAKNADNLEKNYRALVYIDFANKMELTLFEEKASEKSSSSGQQSRSKSGVALSGGDRTDGSLSIERTKYEKHHGEREGCNRKHSSSTEEKRPVHDTPSRKKMKYLSR